MYKVVVVDDEPLATELVLEFLREFSQFELKQVCHDGFEGLKAIQNHNPDLVFLDVQMPKLTGFELLELLDEPPAVIFTTAYDAFAMKAFDAHAIDYLLKPFSFSRFEKAIEKFLLMESHEGIPRALVENPVEELSRVVLKFRNEIKILPIADILFFEANDDYVNIYTNEGKFIKNKTLSFFEKNLDNKEFVRVHRSFLVRVDQIHKLEAYEKEGYMLSLRNQKRIPVSKTGLPKLKSVLGI